MSKVSRMCVCFFAALLAFLPETSFPGHLDKLNIEIPGEVSRAIHHAERKIETVFIFEETQTGCGPSIYRSWFRVKLSTGPHRFDIIGGGIVDWTFRVEYRIGAHFYQKLGSGILVYIDFIVPGDMPYLYFWKHPNYGARMPPIHSPLAICR